MIHPGSNAFASRRPPAATRTEHSQRASDEIRSLSTVSESAEWLIVAAARWCVRRSSPERERPDSLEHGSTFSGVPTLNASGIRILLLNPNREDESQILVGRSFGDINLQLLGIYDGSNNVLKQFGSMFTFAGLDIELHVPPRPHEGESG